jgi:hypothetical protein
LMLNGNRIFDLVHFRDDGVFHGGSRQLRTEFNIHFQSTCFEYGG